MAAKRGITDQQRPDQSTDARWRCLGRHYIECSVYLAFGHWYHRAWDVDLRGWLIADCSDAWRGSQGGWRGNGDADGYQSILGARFSLQSQLSGSMEYRQTKSGNVWDRHRVSFRDPARLLLFDAFRATSARAAPA